MSILSVTILVMAVTAHPSQEPLEAAIRSRIAEVPGARVAVAYRNLARPDSLFLNADSSYHAASTMKVPVMVELFRKVDAGELKLSDSIPLRNEFRSIVDGSPYSLGTGDDSDSSLYARVGSSVPLAELVDAMITRSSNLATNVVIDVAGGGERITATMRTFGARDIKVRRGVEDGKAYQAGLNNTTTARDMSAILAALETGRAASPASTAAMRQILLRQEFNEGIPAGLPFGYSRGAQDRLDNVHGPRCGNRVSVRRGALRSGGADGRHTRARRREPPDSRRSETGARACDSSPSRQVRNGIHRSHR
jgi:beta-lactamase class A